MAIVRQGIATARLKKHGKIELTTSETHIISSLSVTREKSETRGIMHELRQMNLCSPACSLGSSSKYRVPVCEGSPREEIW